METRYTKLTSDDVQHFSALVKLYADVFGIENFSIPPPEYQRSVLSKEHVIIYVALLNGEVAGGLTAYVLPSTTFTYSEAYIYDLAVKTEFQRKGIGRELLHAFRDYCSKAGYREIFVQADIEDQHALDFYQATGGHPERVIHYTYDLKKHP